MRKVIVALAALFLFAFKAEAQEHSDHRHQEYIKVGLVHVEAEVESFNVVINGLSVDIETYFNKKHIGLSGWSFGYRKDDIKYTEAGHTFNFNLFRTTDIFVVDLKLGGGVEFGVVSKNFDQTRFGYENEVLVFYDHLFLKRNLNIPNTGPSHDAVIYPFVEASLVKRGSWYLLETGLRGNRHQFEFDEYHFDTGGFEFKSRQITRIAPSIFVKFGIRLQ